MNLTLFNIKENYLKLINEIEENGGELTDELRDQLTINQDDLKEKVSHYDEIISAKENFNKRIDAEIEELKRKKYTNQKVIDSLKERILDAIKVFGTLNTDLYKFTIRKSISVNIIDISFLPSKYKTVKTVESPDKMYIKKELQNGNQISGCSLVENFHLKKD